MARISRTGPFEYYKGKYFIVFYQNDDETYVTSFNNVREILAYKNMSITRTNVNMMNVELYRALKREDHKTQMLTGKTMRVYIVDIDD